MLEDVLRNEKKTERGRPRQKKGIFSSLPACLLMVAHQNNDDTAHHASCVYTDGSKRQVLLGNHGCILGRWMLQWLDLCVTVGIFSLHLINSSALLQHRQSLDELCFAIFAVFRKFLKLVKSNLQAVKVPFRWSLYLFFCPPADLTPSASSPKKTYLDRWLYDIHIRWPHLSMHGKWLQACTFNMSEHFIVCDFVLPSYAKHPPQTSHVKGFQFLHLVSVQCQWLIAMQ